MARPRAYSTCMKAASVPSHRRRPTGLTPTIGFGQVRRVSPEVVQIGVRTPDAWLRFESTVGGAENLFEQLGAALGHGLNAGGRLRLAELENLMAHAKADRLRLLALAGELTQARTELEQAWKKMLSERK